MSEPSIIRAISQNMPLERFEPTPRRATIKLASRLFITRV